MSNPSAFELQARSTSSSKCHQCALKSTMLTPSSTSDTERPDTPTANPSRSVPNQHCADADILAGSNDTRPSDDGCYTAVTFRSSQSFGTNDLTEASPTPENGKDAFADFAIPQNWPVTLSPDSFQYIHTHASELSVRCADGGSVEPWESTPVSYIPSEHPLGPRDFAPGRYACPYPGCTEAFGRSGQLDGYLGRSLVQHVYRRHGTTAAVDLMSLGLRNRVVSLRREQGKSDLGGYRLPCAWVDPGRDLIHASLGIIEDLEEIRAWEQSRRFSLSIKGDVIFVRPAAELGQQTVPLKEKTLPQQPLDKGKGKSVASKEQRHTYPSPEDPFEREETKTPPSPSPEPRHTPASRQQRHHTAHGIGGRTTQQNSPFLRRLNEVLRSPSKNQWNACKARAVLEGQDGDFFEDLGWEDHDSMDME